MLTKEALFDAAPTAMLYFDDSLCLRYLNRQAERLCKIEAAQVGMHASALSTVVDTDVLEQVRATGEAVSKVQLGTEHASLMLDYTPLEGGVLVSMAPIGNSSDALEQELEAQRAELQAVLDNVPISLVLFEPNGQVRYRNRASYEWLQQGSADNINQVEDYAAQIKVYDSEGNPLPVEEYPISKVVAGAERAVGEMSLVFANGVEREMRQLAVTVRDASGRRQVLVAVAQDITEQIQLHKRMVESRDELQAILDSMVEGVLLFDSDEKVRYRNPAYLRLMGMHREDEPTVVINHTQMGLSYADGRLVPDEDALIPRLLRGEVFDGEEYLLTNLRGEQMVLEAQGSHVLNDEGAVQLGILVMRDLTPAKELERLKDEFISITSHELRTPLTTIKGYTQVLMRRLRKLNMPELSDMQKPLEMIAERTERMVTMVGDLLDVSRIAVGKLEITLQAVDLTSLVEKLIDQLRLTSTHRFTLDLPDEPVLVLGEERLLEQVVTNLLSNAMKYSEAGSAINIVLKAQDNEGIVSVHDNGIGVPKETQERLFERFYRGEAGRLTATGLGLGLYISAGIVRAHKGRIWVQSEGHGMGSTFSFALPLV